MSNEHDIQARLKFLLMDDGDMASLKDFRQVLAPRIDGYLDAFYAHVTQIPELKALFSSPQALAGAKAEQKRHWMENLFSANFGDDYGRVVNAIGRAHERIGLEPRWYMAGYCFVLNELTTLATQTYRKQPDKLARALHAINKAVFLDMDLAISIYLEVGKENAAKTLNDHADRFEQTIKGMVEIVAAAATQLQATARTMEGTATNTSERATAVAAAADEAASNVQTVAAAAEELSASIGEISRQVNQSTETANGAVHEAEKTNEQVQGLAEAANKIGEVVSLINDIASQTNLLALNATIEAARAGEAGKGFAVVASEVKNLANQTAKATEEISAQISGIQGATQEAVTAIRGIGDTIGTISESSSAIAAAVEEQGAATQEIARNVEQASSGTTEVTSNISEVTSQASETGSAAGQVLEAAGELASQAERLSAEVSTFLQTIRA